MEATKAIFARILWLGRGTATAIGLAVLLAVVLGVATTALAAVPGDPFKLGQANTVNAISRLVGKVAGPMLMVDNDSAAAGARALDLRVEPGKAPLTVNAEAGKAPNLSADELDGKDSTAFASGTGGRANDADKLDGKDRTEIGVNGWQQVSNTSVTDSNSPKSITVSCPVGTVVVGTSFDISGGKTGTFPNEQTDVVVDNAEPLTPVPPYATQVFVLAYEETPTAADWSVKAIAICAKRP